MMLVLVERASIVTTSESIIYFTTIAVTNWYFSVAIDVKLTI